MKDILLCEDSPCWKRIFEDTLTEAFPDTRLVSGESVRGALTQLTGIDLTKVSPIATKGIISALRLGNADFSNLGAVVTDGELVDSYAGFGDIIPHGWDLAQILNDLNYTGKIVYIGGSKIPDGKEGFFDARVGKLEENVDKKLVSYVRSVLK